MNESNDFNNENVDINNENIDSSVNPAPYRAMGNLNTAISNPSANINNTMDVNISSVGTKVNNVDDKMVINEKDINSPVVEANAFVPNENDIKAKKTIVTNDNKKKKRTFSLNLGNEFKIVLLIIVVLLIFIFLLPLLPQFF